MASELLPLTPQQRLAAEPDVHAWVSASAGTGKTQVLSARVLRLLIGGARPEGVVALTFTKAAAAEMQNRILDVLGRWVTAPDEVIAGDLRAIGAASDAETLRLARTLFARALEVHGGFRVQTLHSFASSLLAAFPIEAGVTPGYATLDDRSGAQLKRQVLEDAIEEAAADGDAAFLDDLGSLAVRHGDAGAAQMMAALLTERRKLLHLDSAEATQAAVRAFLKLPLQGSREEVLARTIEERTGLMETLRTYGRALEAWNTKTGTDRLVQLRRFIDCEPGGRCFEMGSLFAAVFKDGGKGDVLGNMKKVEAELNAAAEHAEALRDTVWRLEVAEVAALHLRVGSRLAARYGEAKQRLGAVDFDDLIAEAAELLQRVPGAWVLYKLDQRIEHLLVDEGQDTNAAQWRIVHALTAEFFAGEGAREERRTQFAVGDFKQAIFGFQGTDPEEFRKARVETAARAGGVRHPFEDVPLNRSFRSVPAVLTVVDKVLEMKGPAALGMDGEVLPHEPDRNAAGAVTLWPKLWDGEQDEPPDVKEEKDRILAGNIAREVRGWLDAGLFVPSKERFVQPQDILILVRTRGQLVPELVAALHAEQVPVAGADRLRLTSPLVVQDCQSLIRFALQPEDDLSLAELLVSPFLGWSQDELYKLAFRRGERSLWRELREATGERAAEARKWLRSVLAMADFRTPYAFLEAVLSGPLGGRAKLLRRLGEEALDPLEELLSEALRYERAAAPSLQGFLDWLEVARDIDIKRDPETAQAAVRIMTVHGAKGLQAPVVIMADAAKAAENNSVDHILAGEPPMPIFGLRKKELPAALQPLWDEKLRKSAEEGLRLLYVAMTRAEDYLFAGGYAGKGESWYDIMRAAMEQLETEEEESAIWDGLSLRHKSGTEAGRAAAQGDKASPAVKIPDWAREPAPAEVRPPRPLAPSAPDEDSALPPPGPELERAALRGRLLHALFEKLPALPSGARRAAALTWLEARAGDLNAETLADEALAVMDDPANAPLFSRGALREAPVSAVVDERVIAGTIDVLLVDEERVRVVDYKTDRKVPGAADEVPARHRRQMEAYGAALQRIFPDRNIETGLLYTAAPRLIWLGT